MDVLQKARRHMYLYYAFMRNCLAREMEFNTNFLSFIIADLFSIGTAMMFFSIVYSKVDTLGGWTRYETLFFLGTFYLIDALNMMVWMHNTYRLPEYVRTGELDLVLAKPLDAQFYVMTRYFHLGHIGQVIGALVLIAYSWKQLDTGFSLLRLILYMLLSLNGFFILGVAFFIMAEPCLWMVKSSGFMALDSLFHFALKPDGIYGRVLRFFLTIILPMTVIASFPARLVFGKITWWEIVWSFTATGIMLAVSRVLWKYGLKRYESASS